MSVEINSDKFRMNHPVHYTLRGDFFFFFIATHSTIFSVNLIRRVVENIIFYNISTESLDSL